MKWIESLDGPLILMPESCLAFWNGNVDDSEEDDYWRACGISSYIGALPVGPGVTLVLGDMPCATALLPSDLGLGLQRWICADSDEQMDQALRACLRSATPATPEEEMKFEFSGETYLLFDSVRSGWAYSEALQMRPPSGDYRIVTLDCKGERAESIVHLFLPVSP